MYSLLFLAFTSFIFSLVLTPLCRNLFRRWGFLDQPDGGRKRHHHPVPKLGGVPILLACAASYGLLLALPLQAGGIVASALPLVWMLLPAVGIIFLTGLEDDLGGLKPWQKLAGQTAAALWAYFAGVNIHGIGGHDLAIYWSLPLTLAWFIGCTNAFNLIDGVDGLATGVGLFATLTTLVAALLQGNVALAMATVPLAGSLLGFLRYNFNPASIFLGDSGSLTTGFLLGCYGIIWSQKSATLLGMTAPLIALAIPILDVALSILRRFLRGQPIFAADRGHIHHMLLKRGLTPRRVVLLLYGVCGLCAALSLMQSVVEHRYAGAILVLFCLVTWIGVQNLGYAEFRVARRLLLGRAFQNTLNAQLALRTFEVSVEAAHSVEDCWEALCQACPEFGFASVRMFLGGRKYYQNGLPEPEASWAVRIPLSDADWVNFTRANASEVLPMAVAPFVDFVRGKLPLKLQEVAMGLTKKPVERAVLPARSTAAGGS
jgi:UDP-GlcNAc:undecaprenyl-phosphate/decaprenyl-phosphate GlcNAc-1-phosphate transferase